MRGDMAGDALIWTSRDDAGGRRWKIDAEKVVRQVSSSILCQYKVGFGERFSLHSRPHSSFLAGTLLLAVTE